MQKGTIAQVGSPRDIYFKPSNRFVAEFIGAANIIEAPVENGHLLMQGGLQPLAVDAPRRGSVVAMIRPETIRIVDAEAAALSGTVENVSFIGDRQRVLVNGASSRSLAIDAPNTITVEVGERIGLSVAPEAIRILPESPDVAP